MMNIKVELRNVYRDLSAGNLSEAEALSRIRAIKHDLGGKTTGVMQAFAVWRPCALDTHATASAYGEEHVMVCEVGGVGAGGRRGVWGEEEEEGGGGEGGGGGGVGGRGGGGGGGEGGGGGGRGVGFAQEVLERTGEGRVVLTGRRELSREKQEQLE